MLGLRGRSPLLSNLWASASPTVGTWQQCRYARVLRWEHNNDLEKQLSSIKNGETFIKFCLSNKGNYYYSTITTTTLSLSRASFLPVYLLLLLTLTDKFNTESRLAALTLLTGVSRLDRSGKYYDDFHEWMFSHKGEFGPRIHLLLHRYY